MSIIVQKFGGTSVANTERLFNVADIVTKTYQQGHSVVVVVSAQGGHHRRSDRQGGGDQPEPLPPGDGCAAVHR